jgi:hypothetical protein
VHTGAASGDIFTFAEIAAGSPRIRSNSFKRKDPEVSPNSAHVSNDPNKKARIETPKNPLLAALQENSSMLEQVANELLDATGSDPVLVSIASRLCTGMSVQNNVLLTITNEGMNFTQKHNGGDGKPAKQGPPVLPKPVNNATGLQVNQSKVNSRKPLSQQPIGGAAGPWNEVTGKRNQKEKKTNGKENSDIIEILEDAQNSGPDAFTNAVREAERSVVIFNLNLGQSPLLNPVTISSKVTGALIQAAAANVAPSHGDATTIAGEMVNDLLSQVKSMELFGKSTRPCKDPKNPALDASFYTVPVKLSFNNKQVAKQVNDILRQQYKVSTSIPYHKTLKKAMTMAHDKVSKANPGKQVLISLEVSKKCLKPMVRDPPTQSGRKGPANWVATGSYIGLPLDALDPKIRDISENFCLPTSPTFVQQMEQQVRVHAPGTSHSGFSTRKLKVLPGMLPIITGSPPHDDVAGAGAAADADADAENASGEKSPKSGETVSLSSNDEDEMDTYSSAVVNGESPAGLRPAV